MLIDSHAHLSFSAFNDDREEVIKRCEQKQMKVINIGSQLPTSVGAIKIAQENDSMSAVIGIHPIHIGDCEKDPLEAKEHKEIDLENDFKEIVKLVDDDQVVGVGETGLDYFRLEEGDIEETKKLQKEYFIKHLDLAQEKNLPVVLHCRGDKESPDSAYLEMLDILKGRKLTGVIHCFGSTLDIANKFIDLGFYIGITGIVTFGKKAAELERVATNIPLEKLLVETDCPYLTPDPHRGERNEPIHVELVASHIAKLRVVTVEEVINQTGKNAIMLFNLK
jgi:TatD DNase family protein